MAVGEKWKCRAGDLWPRGRLISAVTSPDVRLAVSPSQPIAFAHTHTCNHTVQHTATHTCRHHSVPPRPFLTVPQSCCMLSCCRQTAVFSAFPFFFFFFKLSIDNAINHHVHTGLERMCLSVPEYCYFVCEPVCLF